MFRIKPLFAVALLASANLTHAAAPIVDAQDVRAQNFTQQDESSRQQNQLMAELVMQLNQLQTEIRQLRGQVEEQDYKIKQLTQQQRDMYVDIDQRLNGSPAQVVNSVDTGATNATQSTATEGHGTSEQVVSNEQAQADYNEAIQQLDAKKFAFAKSSFRNFIANYPNENLASNAHYWLGQLHYRDKEFDQAEEQFTKVFEQFSSAQKKDVAMMKLGQIYEKRNEKTQAISMYERLAKEFPATTAGKFAKAKLDTLR